MRLSSPLVEVVTAYDWGTLASLSLASAGFDSSLVITFVPVLVQDGCIAGLSG